MRWRTPKLTMSKALVDTSFAIALMDSKDQHHEEAIRILSKVKADETELVYMDCVVNEIYSVMARKLSGRKMSSKFPEIADEISAALSNVEVINAYRYLPKFHPKVVDLMKQTEGRLNYHDTLIALSLREEKINAIVSLDSDFDEVEWLERISN